MTAGESTRPAAVEAAVEPATSVPEVVMGKDGGSPPGSGDEHVEDGKSDFIIQLHVLLSKPGMLWLVWHCYYDYSRYVFQF